MARNTPSGGKKREAKAPGGNRPLILALAGFTALAIVVIALLAVFSTRGGEAGNFTPNDQGLLPVGSRAPEFTTETVGGERVSLPEGRAAMLVFFATWCPHCQNEAPTIAEFSREYEDLRVMMISVADENWPETDTPQEVRRFVEAYGIQGPAIYDPALGRTYRVTGTPTVYVVDRSGRIVGAHSGEAPREVYEGWIQEALG
ncbi:Thiol-disulfide oxidoreductase ResA [Rubrobacter xylanophilus DSM 9941]|uniref:TlpA family protein disulfide reductase n=1 Tax=Rubrobacter xylanophilus TaxID=49319 RepID=UPI001C63BBB1|nr:TlpA disulfide reductase family protein [Rubrobacter xylanophilus]QYJ16233.1 Thiol-disulfide oxidoreductase ResA [Rubrobacter xylanophilus DSM 9941]